MDFDKGAQRTRMLRLLAVVQHYERNSAVGARLMRGTRYELAVQATDVNGDTCLFPACACDRADCRRRPEQALRVSWNGPDTGWSLR